MWSRNTRAAFATTGDGFAGTRMTARACPFSTRVTARAGVTRAVAITSKAVIAPPVPDAVRHANERHVRRNRPSGCRFMSVPPSEENEELLVPRGEVAGASLARPSLFADAVQVRIRPVNQPVPRDGR